MNLKYLSYLIVALCMLSTCGGDGDDSPNAAVANANANSPLVQDANRLEIPHLKGGEENIFIVHQTDDGLYNYCMEYSTRAVHSRWVAYRYDSKLAAKNYPNRTDAWLPDPALKNYSFAQVAVCTFYGEANGEKYSYQRGHLLGSAERYYSKQANEQTFYMSNMSPMEGAFNGTYWGTIEDKVRDNWGRPIASGDTLYVVKGGTVDDDKILRRIPVPNTNGHETHMVVPKYYFIALLMRKASGTLTAIGFYMEHKDYKNTSSSFLKQLARDSACSIDELEEKTGLDFFCNLPDDVEKTLEASYSISQWQGL